MLGDVVGQNGCRAVCRKLPQLRREYAVDVAVVNGENAAEGNGILPADARALRDAGADVVTTGNHVLRRRFGLRRLGFFFLCLTAAMAGQRQGNGGSGTQRIFRLYPGPGHRCQ